MGGGGKGDPPPPPYLSPPFLFPSYCLLHVQTVLWIWIRNSLLKRNQNWNAWIRIRNLTGVTKVLIKIIFDNFLDNNDAAILERKNFVTTKWFRIRNRIRNFFELGSGEIAPDPLRTYFGAMTVAGLFSHIRYRTPCTLRRLSQCEECISDIVKSLTSALARYTQDVNTVTGTADKREPEYVLYDTATTTLNIYRSLKSIRTSRGQRKCFIAEDAWP